MSEQKVYTLPAIMPAADSEIGRLARRLIEYADLSAVRPLLDMLEEQGRREDARQISYALGAMILNKHLDWSFFVIHAAGCLWRDLLDTTEGLAELEKRFRPKRMDRPVSMVVSTIEVHPDSSPIEAGDPVYTGPGGMATRDPSHAHHTPHFGIANDNEMEGGDGLRLVAVRLTPPPAGASGAGSFAPPGISAASLYEAAAGLEPSPAGTPSPGSPDPSSPPEPPADSPAPPGSEP